MGRKAKDLTGMKFGRLTVVKESGRDKHGKVLWLCKCECGNEIIVRGNSLKSKRTTSCGCLKKETSRENARKGIKDLTGMKFGRLTVIKRCGNKGSNTTWLCKCECGNEIIVRGDYLKSKRTTSCGCLKKEMVGENSSNWKGGITPIREYLRVLPVVIKWVEDAKENVNYTCELIGKQCYVETHHIKPFCELVMEAHVLNGIQIKEIVADYTEEELKLLIAYITKWHQDFSNAIVLSKEVHYYFHNVFMKGKGRESSVEDIEEFKQRYLNGEFKDLLGDDLNV